MLKDYHGAKPEYYLYVDGLAIKESCFNDPIWENLKEHELIQRGSILGRMKL